SQEKAKEPSQEKAKEPSQEKAKEPSQEKAKEPSQEKAKERAGRGKHAKMGRINASAPFLQLPSCFFLLSFLFSRKGAEKETSVFFQLTILRHVDIASSA